MYFKVLLILSILFSSACFGQSTDSTLIDFQFYEIGSSKVLESEYKVVADSLVKSDAPRGSDFKSDYGELLTYVEGLRDEARRNGNINWDRGFMRSAKWIEVVLIKDTELFSESIKIEIKKDIKRIKKFRKPYTNNDLYDRLIRRIVEYYKADKGYIYSA